tara:strand:- start:1809 stop:2018 length:210 start_codon:yes stop_codon:yes gene_type:complete
MIRWAKVREIEFGDDIWINEQMVVYVKDRDPSGSTIQFSSSEDDYIKVIESFEDIVQSWDNWQHIHKDA